MQGASLRHAETLASRPILAESGRSRAVRVGSLKLVVFDDGKRELYDLSKDPSESHNLYAPKMPAFQPLEAAYDRWLRMMPRESSSSEYGVSPDELQRLKGLGYVQ